jgi:hypothetical protein
LLGVKINTNVIEAAKNLNLDILIINSLNMDLVDVKCHHVHLGESVIIPPHLKLPRNMHTLTAKCKIQALSYRENELAYKINGTDAIIRSLKVLKLDTGCESSYMDLSATKIETLVVMFECRIIYPSTLKKLFLKILPKNLKMNSLFPITYGSILEILGVGQCFNSMIKLRQRFTKFLVKGKHKIKRFDVENLAADFEPIDRVVVGIVTNVNYYTSKF